MPDLSTNLHCKCIFLVKKFVLLNKPIIFAMCFIVEHARTGKQIKLSQQWMFGYYESFNRALNRAVAITKARKYPKPIEIW